MGPRKTVGLLEYDRQKMIEDQLCECIQNAFAIISNTVGIFERGKFDNH